MDEINYSNQAQQYLLNQRLEERHYTGEELAQYTGEEIDRAINAATPIGKGLRSSVVALDIDELRAISNEGSWHDPANKMFLERLTNQQTKNDLFANSPAPPATIDLAG